ncbi:hypothetical protein M0812_16422 [Anaeramoeba flamelloides]|uniref:Uncharacterized protein n=1 Tax=Anaeramoeba flamelloides TaxID=1746091 RepID=A0AAV7ZKI8_9EUKA|nr:hypothetical protein M0812_16422 [Anaeramoeba flamelloides]
MFYAIIIHKQVRLACPRSLEPKLALPKGTKRSLALCYTSGRYIVSRMSTMVAVLQCVLTHSNSKNFLTTQTAPYHPIPGRLMLNKIAFQLIGRQLNK